MGLDVGQFDFEGGFVVLFGDGQDFDFLDHSALIGVEGGQAVQAVFDGLVGGRVAQDGERLELGDPLPGGVGVHPLLRFVHHNDGLASAQGVEIGLAPIGIVAAGAVDDAVIPDDGLNRHHHDLRVGVLDERAQARELGAVVLEAGRGEAVAVAQLLAEILEGGKRAFLYGYGGHQDNELGQAIAFVKLVHRAEIDERFARARFHFDADVLFGSERGIGFGYPRFGEHGLFVGLNLFGG